jgi:hypothetical protein
MAAYLVLPGLSVGGGPRNKTLLLDLSLNSYPEGEQAEVLIEF